MSDRTAHPRPGLLAAARDVPLHRRLEQATERAAYLSRTVHDISGAMHTDRAVDLVLEMLAGDLVDWAQVTLMDRRLYRFRCRTLDGRYRSAEVPMSSVAAYSCLGRVLSTGTSDLVTVPDGEGSDSDTVVSAVPATALRETLAGIRPVELLTIALRGRGTTYGALTVAIRAGGFDDAAVRFLEDFAHRVALTIDTARALADSRRVAAVLSRELDPPTLPRLTGVRFASYYRVAFEQESLGGDFYDVHGDDGDWTAVVGDVCGKGVEAAVLTGKVRQAVRTAALVDRDPGFVLGLVNRVLVAGSEETFVTAVCARGRVVEGVVRLDIASAGHPEPMVVRRDGTVEPVEASGTVLGLLAETSYRTVTVDLSPGETCVFYTDGVPEAPGRGGRFGDDRMREVLLATGPCDASAQVESVAVALAAHLRDRAHDDIAILAVQCCEP